MRDQAFAKLAARVSALEVLLVEALAYIHWKQDNPVKSAEDHRKKFQEMGSSLSIPGYDPAKSDFAVGEVGDAIDDLAKLVIATLKGERPPQ